MTEPDRCGCRYVERIPDAPVDRWEVSECIQEPGHERDDFFRPHFDGNQTWWVEPGDPDALHDRIKHALAYGAHSSKTGEPITYIPEDVADLYANAILHMVSLSGLE